MARTQTTPPPEGMRRCIGSAKFGIEPHDAPISDFNAQPSQKDGLARMCKTDWSRYTRALRTGSTEAAPRTIGEAVSQREARKAPTITAENVDEVFPSKSVEKRVRAQREPVAAPVRLPQTMAEEASPEGQQALADGFEAGKAARKAFEREAARIRMANLRAARKAAAAAQS